MKLDKATADMVVAKLRQDIDDADSFYEEDREPHVIEQYQIYNAEKAFYDKMFPVLSKKSSLTDCSVADTIEWTMPALMKMFTASEDVITITGVTVEDDEPAERMQQLINYQLQRKNKFFGIMYQWFKDALITNLGVIKCYWDRDERIVRQQVQLSPDALIEFEAQPKVKIVDIQPDMVTGTLLVVFDGPKVVKNQPVIENILHSEFRYSSDANNLDDADFVAHRKIVSIDYLRKKADSGLYDKAAVRQVAETAKDPDYTTLDYENNPHLDEEKQKTDRGRLKTELYECYVKMALSDDPEEDLKDYIVTICQDVILRIEENHYGRHPFFVISPILDPHKVFPEHGFVDLIGPLQHLKTAMIKQITHNIAISNNPQMAVNMAMLVDVNDVLESKQLVRTNGAIAEAIQPLARPQLQPWTFNMLDYVDQQRASRTGITPYNQGVDQNGLNKTATGVNLIQQAANQRIELIARIFSETGLNQLFRFLIELNQKFIDQDQVIRLTNETLTIRPDDLRGEFDLVVNAGMGNGTKEAAMMQAQQLGAIVEKLASVGLAGPEQFYNAGKKMLETIGEKNIDAYIISPEQQAQQQKPPQVDDFIKVTLDDLPINARVAYLNSKGIPVTIEDFMQQMQLDAQNKAVEAEIEAKAKQSTEEHKAATNALTRTVEHHLKGGANGQGTQINGVGAGSQAIGNMQGVPGGIR